MYLKINAVMLCVSGLVLMSISSIFQTAFHAFQKMQYQSFVIFIQECLFLFPSFIILYLKIDFIYIFFSYLISRFLSMIFSGIIYHYKIHIISLNFDKIFIYKLIKEAFPFVMNLFFTTVYARSAILVISYRSFSRSRSSGSSSLFEHEDNKTIDKTSEHITNILFNSLFLKIINM